MASSLRACVLAAGKGTRMGGDRPKVLFEAGGRPLIEWCLRALSAAGVDETVVVVGFGKDDVIRSLPTGVRWAEQSPQLGTGHAVMCARPQFPSDDSPTPILVVCGDMPLLKAESFRRVAALRAEADAACAMLTVAVPPESSFGRVVRDDSGKVLRIVEVKDATEEERRIPEGNPSVYVFRPDALWSALEAVGNDNAQGEYYLTDVIGILIARGETVAAVRSDDPGEAIGVNTPEDLARVEAALAEQGERTR
jgi:bifunctional UDP-N-acetylglucosamine pyrophosphorylase/glucosamine-1-phosphate N-acetyltransferase